MAVISPTVTAYDIGEYNQQLKHILPFAERIHLDLMDGTFAPTQSPHLENIRLPHGPDVDIHLMYQEPMDVLHHLIRMRPHMVVVHNEAHVHHMHFVAELHRYDIKAGLAILPETPIEYAYQIMHSFDHVLLFSGKLGYHGGEADLTLLERIAKIRDHHIDAEIGWDGGINASNAHELVNAGVDVLNVGGYIQKSSDPAEAFQRIKNAIQ